MFFAGPRFKAQIHIWGYRLTPASREAEMSRLLVESSATVKEEAQQHDRSPLEAQREWRHQAENNVLDLLERNGLLAPQGEVDKVLNTIVKNLEITNNLEEQIDLRCRALLTGNLEMFSVGGTIVLSRGLIDVVPDEATMGAMLAHGMADAMLPKPYQDQYGFSDTMRLTATEVLKRLSFQEEKNGSRGKQPEGYGTSQEISLRIKTGQCGPVPRPTSRAIEPPAALNQSAAWESCIFQRPVDGGVARPSTRQQRADGCLASGFTTQERSLDRCCQLDEVQAGLAVERPRQNALRSDADASLLDPLCRNLLVTRKLGSVCSIELAKQSSARFRACC